MRRRGRGLRRLVAVVHGAHERVVGGRSPATARTQRRTNSDDPSRARTGGGGPAGSDRSANATFIARAMSVAESTEVPSRSKTRQRVTRRRSLGGARRGCLRRVAAAGGGRERVDLAERAVQPAVRREHRVVARRTDSGWG